MFDKFNEECAVFGAVGIPEASNFCYLGLYAQQHRGQEGAGIASTDSHNIFVHRAMGLVADVFPPNVLNELKGAAAIGHNRYATCGSKDWLNLQPLVANLSRECFAVAHNGNLVNAGELRKQLELEGAIFSATSDSEVFLHLIARTDYSLPMVDRVAAAVRQIKGAFSVVILTQDGLIAVRDTHGVRPLSLASLGEGFVVSSETCAFDLIGAKFIREIEPGEVLEITHRGTMTSGRIDDTKNSSLCVFEFIYFSRPDSTMKGKNIYSVRKKMGAQLAKEHKVDADLVVPVPSSGVAAAIGYAQEANIPMEFGLVRNHYVGRTFIEPKQSIRDFGVKLKLNANRGILEGKRVILVDDSIVRGTTCRKLVNMVREAGAKEVHFRVSSPPTVGSCHYGIDTPSENELIASSSTVEQIRNYIGADTLGYLSIDGLYEAVEDSRSNYCDACFSKNYPLGVSDVVDIGRRQTIIGQKR